MPTYTDRFILTAEDRTKAAAASAAANMRKIGGAGRAAGRDAASGMDSATTSVKRLVTQLTAGFVGFQGLRALLGQFTKVAGDFERARIQLNSLFGDAAKGEAAFAWVKTFAKDTPFELDGVLKAFQTLKNFGLDPMDGTLQAIADQSALFGGSQESLQGISLALGQAWAAQRLQGQDILQLINQGVPVWELLAKVTGKNAIELREMSSAGELGRDVIKALIAEIGRSAGGASLAQMQTFGGVVSNVKDTWAQFLDQIAQSGALDSIKEPLENLLATTEALAESGDLEAFAQSVSDTISSIVGLGGDAVGILASLSGELRTLAELWVAAKVLRYAEALKAMALAGPLAGGGLAATSAALTVLGRALFTLPLVVLVDQLGRLAGAAIDHRDAVRGMAAEYDKFARTQEKAIKANADAAEASILPIDTLRRATREEQNSYTERLRAAQVYWRAVFELEARRPDGDRALAEQANRQERAYRQALADLRPVLDERIRVEQASADRIADLKKSETDAIVAELGRQKAAYDAANDAIKAANSERDRLIKDARDLVADVSAPPTKKDPTSLDALRLSSRAEDALRGGDLEGSLRLAKQAGEVLRSLAREGKGGTLVQQTAKRVADTQIAAAEQQAAQITAQQEAEKARVQAAIDDLATRAKALEALKVGFDSAQTITDAQSLRAALEKELAANPITVHVQLDTSSAGADLLKDAVVTPPGRAFGGYIPGRSPHPRADNILIRATAGEYMLPVGAVQRLTAAHGAGVLEQLRRGHLPGYADGGAVARQLLSGLDSGARPNLAAIAGNPALPAAPTTTINLTLPTGQTYTVRTDADTAKTLQRDIRLQAIKSGKR